MGTIKRIVMSTIKSRIAEAERKYAARVEELEDKHDKQVFLLKQQLESNKESAAQNAVKDVFSKFL